MKPPQLPEATLQRVLRTSKVNGWSVVIFASGGVLLSLVFGDWSGTAVGLLVALGGVLEVQGHRQVARGDVAGMPRMIRGQWVVLGAILVYCVSRLGSFDAESALDNLTPGLRSELASSGVDVEEIIPLVRATFYATYSAIALVTVIYQGGLARYYRRRRPVVEQALADRRRPAPPARPGPAPEDLVT
jgi:hypothetical protein